MKKVRNIFLVMVIIFQFFVVSSFTIISNAEPVAGAGGGGDTGITTKKNKNNDFGDAMEGADQFLEDGKFYSVDILKGDQNDPDSLPNVSDYIFNIVLAIGIIMAVAIGAVLGVKFMISSVEEQAKIKELLVPYVAGCIVVFGAFGIWKIAVNIFNTF